MFLLRGGTQVQYLFRESSISIVDGDGVDRPMRACPHLRPCKCHKAFPRAGLSNRRGVHGHERPSHPPTSPPSSHLFVLFLREALLFSHNLSALLIIRPPVCFVRTFMLFATIFGRFFALPASSHLPDNLTIID